MVFRWAKLEDLEEMLSLRMEAVREIFSFKGNVDCSSLEGTTRDYYALHLRTGTHAAIIVEENGIPVGTGGICFEEELPSPDNPSGRSAYLMNVYVRPEERGKGIGTEIVRRLLKRCEEERTGKIYLESTPLGRKVYYKLGFVDFPYLLRLPVGKNRED